MYTDSIVEEQTLLVVLDTGSFSAAAVELGVSQSSVSRRIAALEDRLGGRRPLSRRTAKGSSRRSTSTRSHSGRRPRLAPPCA